MAVTQYFLPAIQPGVVRNFVADFSANLDASETIVSATVVAAPEVLDEDDDNQGLTAVDSPVIGRVDARGRNFVADPDGPCVLQVFSSGTALGDYTLTFQAATSTDQTPAATFGVAIALRS